MIKFTKEELRACVTVITRERYPDKLWLGKNFNAHHLGMFFPEELSKEAALKRVQDIPPEYYGFYSCKTLEYVEYATIAEQLIKWIEKRNS